MSFSMNPYSHHVEAAWPETNAFVQMGQPTDTSGQRQQTDDLPRYHDSHGIERELQFSDLGCRESQPMG